MNVDNDDMEVDAASDITVSDASTGTDITAESSDTDVTEEPTDTDVTDGSSDRDVTDFSDDGTDVTDSSDDDPQIDDWINLNPAYHQVPFFQFVPDFKIPDNVLPHGETCQAKDTFFQRLCGNIARNKPYDDLLDDFDIENAKYADPIFPQTKYQLWNKIGRNTSNIKNYVYCGYCKARVGDDKVPAVDCTCGSTGPNRGNKKLHYFTHVSIKAQLAEMFRLPNMVASLNYRNTRIKINGNAIEDIFDGKRYKELLQDFLANPNNYSFTIWIDGLEVAKSSTEGATPVFLMINEFSPHGRKRYMILAGVFVGTGKPCINQILQPVIEELTNLYHEGITWTPVEGGEPRTSRFITLMLSCDSDARYAILNMTRFNGL